MSTLTGRPATALLVIDVQNGVVGEAHERDAVVGRIARLVDGARTAGVPVVWVRHQAEDLPVDSKDWQIVPELLSAQGEPIVAKEYGDSFEATDLEELLAHEGVGTLVVTGAETDACIRSTVHGGFTRGYDVTLVGDAHTTNDYVQWGAPSPEAVIGHINLYWDQQAAPGRTARVVDAADVSFAPTAG